MRLASVLLLATATAAFAIAVPIIPSASPNASVDPGAIGKAPITSWPTFNGDYSGRRYSTLTQITPSNVSRLTQQWIYKITDVGSQRGAPVPIIKCTPLLV